MTTPTLLIIRDGWGANHNPEHDAFNAVKLANTPCSDQLSQHWPRTEILACGLDVGLPESIMGNSEVGHQNIGAGRIVDQEIVRINKGLSGKDLLENAEFKKVIQRTHSGGKLHLLGLVSDAGVHAMIAHLFRLLDLAKESGLKEVYIHVFSDGRDTPPTSGLGFVRQLEAYCKEIGLGKIATVSGRFWAMDRDKRWNRVQKAYDCLTGHKTEHTATSAQEAIQHYYDNPSEPSCCGDEFIPPTQILDQSGNPVARIEDGDSVIFFNFRGDRPRELTRAFIEEDFSEFDRGQKKDLLYVTMTEYQKGLCEHILFRKPAKMKDILGEYISEKGIAQFRCAETEKYPHVTFFFNDYRDEPFPLEERALIPSPKDVTTYDQKPEMSSVGVTEATEEAIRSGKYGLIVVNYANPDMVGHTGSLEAAKKACEATDAGITRLLKAIDEMSGNALITADHGNSDQMWEPETSAPHTRHTLNPVEVVIYGKDCEGLTLKEGGRLADLAPTLLKLMGLEQPKAMTGECLIQVK
tara:strand:- start:23611 stop:25182 length:1572 start_codon:yes stop_codon:yes gene_type:complete